MMLKTASSGAALGAFAQPTVVGITYAQCGYAGVGGVVSVLSGGTAAAPLGIGYVIVSAAGFLAGAVANKFVLNLSPGHSRNKKQSQSHFSRLLVKTRKRLQCSKALP